MCRFTFSVHWAGYQMSLKYIYEQTASCDNRHCWWTNYHDDYDLFMHYGSGGALDCAYGMEQLGFWNKILTHSVKKRENSPLRRVCARRFFAARSTAA